MQTSFISGSSFNLWKLSLTMMMNTIWVLPLTWNKWNERERKRDSFYNVYWNKFELLATEFKSLLTYCLLSFLQKQKWEKKTLLKQVRWSFFFPHFRGLSIKRKLTNMVENLTCSEIYSKYLLLAYDLKKHRKRDALASS